MLKAAFIGCGGIAGAHVGGWKAVREAGAAGITALCDVSSENVDKLAKALGLEQVARYTDWQQMLAEQELDAVDICLPHHLHAPAILDAAAKRVNVLCEKPLCMTLPEASRIEQAVASSGITLMCAHNQLFIPAIQHLRAEIDRGVIGEVQMVFSGDCFRLNRTVEEWGWRGQLETAGGGVLIDTGYHPTYRLLHMAKSAPAAVTSMTHNFHCGIEGEDTANVLVRFASQAMGQILTSWAFPMQDGAWQVAVFGSEGTLFGRGNEYLFKPYDGEAVRGQLEGRDAFAEEIKHFVNCLQTGAVPIQTQVDGINVLKLILGAYEAQQTGRTVTF